jgi:glycosyltransferase 2 family protein
MRVKALNIGISILIAGLFLWIAFRNTDFTELWNQISTVTWYWVPFFVAAMTFSHILRAERWRLLMPDEYQKISRSTLFAGVMLGYVVNNLIPRLGEISRPIYVGKKEDVSSGNLVGTIVAERLFDLITMLFLIFLTILIFFGDLERFQQVFGIEEWQWIHYSILPLVLAMFFAGIWLFRRAIVYVDQKSNVQNPVLAKLMKSAKSFGEGMVSLKKVKNWPLFLLLTGGIWTGYIIMTYVPFFMMEMQQAYGLNLLDAVVLTMVSTIGVSIPTPAAIGSYHLFMQQGMWLLYDVPLTNALTYATVVHASTVLFVFIIGPIALWWDKYHSLTSHQNG